MKKTSGTLGTNLFINSVDQLGRRDQNAAHPSRILHPKRREQLQRWIGHVCKERKPISGRQEAEVQTMQSRHSQPRSRTRNQNCRGRGGAVFAGEMSARVFCWLNGVLRALRTCCGKQEKTNALNHSSPQMAFLAGLLRRWAPAGGDVAASLAAALANNKLVARALKLGQGGSTFSLRKSKTRNEKPIRETNSLNQCSMNTHRIAATRSRAAASVSFASSRRCCVAGKGRRLRDDQRIAGEWLSRCVGIPRVFVRVRDEQSLDTHLLHDRRGASSCAVHVPDKRITWALG